MLAVTPDEDATKRRVAPGCDCVQPGRKPWQPTVPRLQVRAACRRRPCSACLHDVGGAETCVMPFRTCTCGRSDLPAPCVTQRYEMLHHDNAETFR